MVFGQTFGAGVKQDHPRRGSLGRSLRVRPPDSVSRLAVLPVRAWEKVLKVKYGWVGLRV